MKRALILAAFLFSAAAVAAAEESALPKEAQQMEAKAAALENYRARFALETKEENGELVRLEGTLSFQRPNRRRLEIRQGGSENLAQMLVADGKVEWHYYPTTASLYRVPIPKEIPGPHRPFGETQPGTVRFIEKAGSGSDVRLKFEATPAQTILEGSPVPIRLLRVEVGEQDGLVRQLVLLGEKGEEVLSQRYYDVQVNTPVPEGEYTFTPPEGVPVVDMQTTSEPQR